MVSARIDAATQLTATPHHADRADRQRDAGGQRLGRLDPPGGGGPPAGADHDPVDIAVIGVVDRRRRTGTDRHGENGDEGDQRMDGARRDGEPDAAREHHELHHVGLEQASSSRRAPPARPRLPGRVSEVAVSIARAMVHLKNGQEDQPAGHRRPAGWCRPQRTCGSSSKVWNGGGELSVHSSVVAPSPHGLSAHFGSEVKIL